MIMNHYLKIKSLNPDISTWNNNDDPLRKQKQKSNFNSLNRDVNSRSSQVPQVNQSSMNSERTYGSVKKYNRAQPKAELKWKYLLMMSD